MSWTAHGAGRSGFFQEAGKGNSRSRPAITVHCGRLWCLWADCSGQLWYAATTEDGHGSTQRQQFPFSQTGIPLIASVHGKLHAVLIQYSGKAFHYCLDADGANEWRRIGTPGTDTDNHAALYAFHDQLFLAYVRYNALYCMVWDHLTLDWERPFLLAKDEQPLLSSPSLVVIDGELHVFCAVPFTPGKILAYKYNERLRLWIRTNNAPQWQSALGNSFASYGKTLYMGSINGRPGSENHKPHIAKYNSGAWCPQESIGDAETTAADTPQIAILNGRIHAIFLHDGVTQELRWFSRPILDYSPSSWMAGISDNTLLSNMTIPGTHDSPARTTIPFVKTQNLTVTQQLALGIRFFDIRLRLHKDGRLYCYHGGIPLGWPRVLSFDSVMDEIWGFFRDQPTETVLISINNDNNSRSISNAPAIFYNAIGAAILTSPRYPDGSSRWVIETTTSRLGDVRGRAVLLRRYLGHPSIKPALRHGIDLSAWVNDSPDFTIVTPAGVVVRLQDKWKYSERIGLRELVASKSKFVEAMMRRASSSRSSTPSGSEEPKDLDEDIETDDSDSDATVEDGFVLIRPNRRSNIITARTYPSNHSEIWYVNFCSAVGEPMEHGEVAQARWVAVGGYSNAGEWIDGVNVSIGDYLREQGATDPGKKRLGIVPMDYPELPQGTDLVSQLIETNF